MKNWKKITLITGAICTVLGVILLIFGLFAGGIQYLTSTDLSTFNSSGKSAAKVQKLVTEELTPYKNLDVSLDSLNLQVRYSKDNTYALSYKNTKTSKTKSTAPIIWSQSGNTLKIRERNLQKHTYFHIDLNFLINLFGNDDEKEAVSDEDMVTLYIPKNAVFDQITLESNDGNLLLNNLRTSQGIIHVDDGDIIFKNCALRNTLLTSNDGDVLSTATTYSGNTTITCKDGDVLFYRAADVLKPLSLKLETNDGEIIVPSSFSGKVKEKDDKSIYQQNGRDGYGTLSIQSEDGDIILHS